MNILHIYAQWQWHDEAYIVGDRQSLGRLRDAINGALRDGQAKAESMTNDGEGYDAIVLLVEDEEQLRRLANPYEAEHARGNRDDTISPCDIWVQREERA